MPVTIKHKHAWDKVRLHTGPNYIEARESKPGETTVFVLLVVGPAVGFVWFYLATLSTVDDFARAMVAVLLSIPAIAALILYRPPRVLRLYPEEAVAQTARRLLAWQVFGKWHDLSGASLRVERARLIAGEREAGGGAAAVGCVLMLFGPLGLIASLLLNSSRDQKRYLTAFALVSNARPARPIAVFIKRADPHKLVTLYNGIDAASAQA